MVIGRDRILTPVAWRTALAIAESHRHLPGHMLVSPIIRPYTRCPSPFGVIDATMPGSGKAILAGDVATARGVVRDFTTPSRPRRRRCGR